MARKKIVYACSNCGARSPKWLGRCLDCGEWNTFEEFEIAGSSKGKSKGSSGSSRVAAAPGTKGKGGVTPITDVSEQDAKRIQMGIPELDRVLGGGLVRGSLILLGGDPGVGKCLVGETRVLDPDSGEYLPITAWRERLRRTLTVDPEQLTLAPASTVAFHEKGTHPVVRVQTRLGRQLRCTPSHPLLTADGWKPVEALTKGQRIAAPRELPYFGDEIMANEEARLLGYMLSDGSSVGQISVTTQLDEVEEELRGIAKFYGLKLVSYEKANNKARCYRFSKTPEIRQKGRDALAKALRKAKRATGLSWSEWARKAGVGIAVLSDWQRAVSAPREDHLRALAEAIDIPYASLAPEARKQACIDNPIATFLKKHGIFGLRAADKFVPPAVFRLPREQLSAFLKALFTGDGSVWFSQTNNAAGVSYATCSRRLAEDVQHLLLRFGLVMKLRTKKATVSLAGMKQAYTSYELTAQGAAQTRLFLSEIGILGRQDAIEQVAHMDVSMPSTHRDTVPTGSSFWEALQEATGALSYREISAAAGVTIRNRRRERPLSRYVVSALAEAFAHPRLQALGEGDVYWDEIVSIEPDGEAEVYDLTVPQGANFVAQDLIVHNSTMATEAAGCMARQDRKVLYISGEESMHQTRMRAARIDCLHENILLFPEIEMDRIQEEVQRVKPELLIVDSIQSVYCPDIPSTPGTVSQLRETTGRLMHLAKRRSVPTLLIGHVTKDGVIAGPRMLEHMVDTVLYFEGDRGHSYRILRAVKNRFGSTNEIGIFEMTEDGLDEVGNPSSLFLDQRPEDAPGSVVTVCMEGTRPILVEVQSLIGSSAYGTPRRTCNGVDPNRVALLVAILEKHGGLNMGGLDIFANVAGGFRLMEPSADLAVTMALASSFRGKPLHREMAIFGEIGLTGEIRAVSQAETRVREALKLGFSHVVMPENNRERLKKVKGAHLIGVRTVEQALSLLG